MHAVPHTHTHAQGPNFHGRRTPLGQSPPTKHQAGAGLKRAARQGTKLSPAQGGPMGPVKTFVQSDLFFVLLRVTMLTAPERVTIELRPSFCAVDSDPPGQRPSRKNSRTISLTVHWAEHEFRFHFVRPADVGFAKTALGFQTKGFQPSPPASKKRQEMIPARSPRLRRRVWGPRSKSQNKNNLTPRLVFCHSEEREATRPGLTIVGKQRG